MDDYIQLSTLNDFIFCPYSIYLHSVYMESDGDLYKAAPQTKGTLAHQGVDEKKGSTRKSDIMSLPVYCDELGISGKIDVYKQDKRLMVERKNNLKRIFRGQIMFTHKDIEMRTIFVVNCIEHDRSLRVNCGELMLEEIEGDKKKTLTKFPFQKLLALFIIGHITVTTPLIDKCKKYGVALVVMKPNLRPVFFWANSAEANYLLRKRQFEYSTEDLSIAKCIVYNKVLNQKAALAKTRKKDSYTEDAIKQCDAALVTLPDVDEYNQLMGLEGTVAKTYFSAYYQNQNWRGRHPRMKSDVLNVTLDIGYSILFNFMESFIRMFGFDLYVGVYHRLWFKRKSLVCDLMEPFRCIIDHATLLAFNRKQFSEKDFTLIKQEYHLKYEKCADYYKVFYDELIARKMDIFKFVQQYYRCFMGCKSVKEYPIFEF